MKWMKGAPPPQRKYLIRRGDQVCVATPCYGMHEPWWIVQTLDGEARPRTIQEGDLWYPLEVLDRDIG